MRYQPCIIVFSLLMLAGCGAEGDKSDHPAEPRIIFRADDGREITTADLTEATGTFEYQIMGDGQIPREARSLHDEARQLGASGDYGGAIKAFKEAQSLAPDWPYPTYDLAFTYLLMKDFTKAREHYRKTVELSPRGFFTAITALDTLDREAAGDLPEGTYSAYMALEWISDPTQKAGVVQQMTEKFSTFAPVWKELALQSDDTVEKLEAIEEGLAAKPDRETEGMLLINKALALNEMGDKETAEAILGNLALNPETTYTNEHLAKQTLAFIVQ